MNCPDCNSKRYLPYTNPHSKVTRNYCRKCGYGLNEVKDLLEKESNYLTSEEAKQSIKEGCDKKDMADCFGISLKVLNQLVKGNLKKIKIPRTSIWYEEDENITDIRSSISDFIKDERSIGANQSSIELALRNILRETIEDLFPKRKIKA